MDVEETYLLDSSYHLLALFEIRQDQRSRPVCDFRRVSLQRQFDEPFLRVDATDGQLLIPISDQKKEADERMVPDTS